MNLADKAYRRIKTEITTCALAPGQQVVQSQLAKRLRLGMTPVRDALQRLAQEGLVQVVPRSGYIVAPLTLADLHSLFEIRSILECAAIRLAAARAADAQLEAIARRARFTYTYRDRRTYIKFLDWNLAFHCSIAGAAGNPKLSAAISDVLAELQRVFHLGLDLRDSAAEMQSEHQALSEALQARDADRAESIFRAQNELSEARVREALVGSFDRRPRINGLHHTIRLDTTVQN